MNDFGPLPLLTGDRIEKLASGWDDGGLWADVLWLADRFLTGAAEAERVAAWHHLVLAVGNFKRQPGRRLRPAQISSEPPPVRPGQAFTMPGSSELSLDEVIVDPDDPTSWAELERSLHGAGVPTATTLLAALFPTRHFVFDWRVGAAAVGLRCGASPPTPVDPMTSAALPATWDSYGMVREWVLATAAVTGRPLVEVERSLYRLSREVPAAKGRTWLAYGAAIVLRLETVGG